MPTDGRLRMLVERALARLLPDRKRPDRERLDRERLDRERRGRRAETLAALMLSLKGYRILARRARTPAGELDLVAVRGRILAFVEVKARTRRAAALEAVTPKGQERVERAAELWVARRRDLGGLNWRFDIVAVTPGRLPHHLRDAWRPGAPR